LRFTTLLHSTLPSTYYPWHIFTGPLPPISRYTYILELPLTYETCSMSYPLYHVTTTNHFVPSHRVVQPLPNFSHPTTYHPLPGIPTLLLISLRGIPLCYVSSTPLCLGLHNAVSHSDCHTTTFPLARLYAFLLRSIRNYTMFF